MHTPRFQLTEKHRRFLAGVSIVIFIVFSLLAAWFIGRPMIHFVQEPELFRDWVDSHGLFGAAAFVGMVAIQVIIAIIPGEPLEIGAGYAFGFWEGTLLSLAGIVIGSTIVFLLVRRFGRRIVEIFFDKEKINSLRFLRNSRKRNLLLFLVMLIPGTPKDLLSYFVGLLDISLPRWLLIVTIARLPSLITSTMGGHAVGEQQYLFALIVFAATILISVLGLLLYRKLSDDKGKSEK